MGRDFLQFFRSLPSAPDAGQGKLPVRRQREYGHPKPEERAYYEEIEESYVPGYPDHQRRGGIAKQMALGFQWWFQTPAWVAALAAVGGLGALAAGLVPRRRVRMEHLPEIVLLVGGPVFLLLATAATAAYDERYLMSVFPLLVAGGTLALLDLGRSAAPGWRKRPSPGPASSAPGSRAPTPPGSSICRR